MQGYMSVERVIGLLRRKYPILSGILSIGTDPRCFTVIWRSS